MGRCKRQYSTQGEKYCTYGGRGLGLVTCNVKVYKQCRPCSEYIKEKNDWNSTGRCKRSVLQYVVRLY
jgi:hypothetical protein